MMRTGTHLLVGIIIALGLSYPVSATETVRASEKQVAIYFFWADGCPHCAQEKPFLKKLQKKYPQARIYEFEVLSNNESRALLRNVGGKLKVDVPGVPFTVICGHYFTGWYNEEITGAAIENAVQDARGKECVDVVRPFLAFDKEPEAGKEESQEKTSVIPLQITVPVFGKIETKNLSLPLFAVVMGGLDGFNPCAMWVLVFLIGLLLGMNDRKRMWILGSAFIIASAAVYFLFMAAWLNLLLFVGFIVWIRVIIGLIAIGGGLYSLREFFVNKESVCNVTGEEKRRKVFGKLKEITQRRRFLLALGGIIVLAGAVNLVELICSAGLPVVFTQVLALSNLSSWQYYFYIVLYIFVYMLDDLTVFFIAMITLQMTGITARYARYAHLVGGMVMVSIGILLIVKPEWLMFG